jgi:pimeloyl-ACP methyl ester carboxylesterase
MIDLGRAFGAHRRLAASWDPVVVIRHGFSSSHKRLVGLASFLATQFPHATINNEDYPWRDSVLVNGGRLAHRLLQEPSYQGRDWILVGHSMGGLVCRVANCILRDPMFAIKVLPQARSLGYAGGEVLEIQQYGFGVHSLKPVAGLVTLATPNSGALLHGQVSGIAALTQKLLNVFPPTQVSSVADLTTDRLFQILQYEAVDCPVLSVSGSKWNRFAGASGQIARWMGMGGIQLDMPHDSIVEDRSVNLASSILANEVLHQGTSPYLHLRLYEGCTDVTHTNIYDDATVQSYLVDFLLRC